MKNIKTILIFFGFTFLVSACDTVRKGFTPDKRSGEEFLVEKKSPLVMPPSYNELPIPSQESKNSKNVKIDIKSLITGKKDIKSNEINSDKPSSIEKLILKEIKKN